MPYFSLIDFFYHLPGVHWLMNKIMDFQIDREFKKHKNEEYIGCGVWRSKEKIYHSV